MSDKLWGGRFTKNESQSALEFNASIGFDKRLYRQDIAGSRAHAKMLAKCGIISQEDAEAIDKGLEGILQDIEDGKIEFTIDNEDIHMNIESILTERIGEPGKRLHTARSRNDQVAVDFRMWTREAVENTMTDLKRVMHSIYDKAEEGQDIIMPGYTHLQRAQPVTFAFYMMAYFQMFKRDYSRFEDCLKRMNENPLGAGAMSGTGYVTDRQFTTEALGFDRVCANAMDAVSDRDYALEYLSNASICAMHLSRFCEELILWSSAEFSFIEIDDAYSTGSSIMPQKKNPDMAELIRGKTGRVYGDMMTLFTIMKGLPLAYNKDMQEDKPPVFDAYDTLSACINIFADMLDTMTVKAENMANAASKGFTNATDAADYLVSKGVPFRECHAIIGEIVLYCINHGKAIEELTLDQLRDFAPEFDEDVYQRIDIRSCIKAKRSEGSTSFDSVKKMLADSKDYLDGLDK
ncbi:MAG: argininosuccinate lyase [Anaerovoracaceae bacterium]|nr:argininosuccinate lyase [Bacillota bacterium]MDY2671083.1 argininosuccinate lyase [Anaerovoracaceae bacterium]